jgi:hypothetical protein
MRSATWDAVRAPRLARSLLTEPARGAESLAGIARELCGVHAQVQASAELQLAARGAGVTRDSVRQALWEQRSLVKAWTLRGTLHLHPSGELALWHAARHAASESAERQIRGWTSGEIQPGPFTRPFQRTRSAPRVRLCSMRSTAGVCFASS